MKRELIYKNEYAVAERVGNDTQTRQALIIEEHTNLYGQKKIFVNGVPLEDLPDARFHTGCFEITFF